MKWPIALVVLVAALSMTAPAFAQSVEDNDGCHGTTDDPCVRTGSCTVQGATWSQTVSIARSDLYDTMGWAGVCDQVHVALVQGNCSPGGVQVNVTVFLEANSTALIPEIIGLLTCNADPPPAIPALRSFFALALAAGVVASAGVSLLGTRRSDLAG